MSDIVERLRLESSVLLAFGQDFSDVLLDAALEIERLRADSNDWAFNYSKDMERLKKEIKRLKSALRGVIDASRQALGEFKTDE